MQAIVLNPPRKRRRRGRNTWFGHPKLHARAAKKGWRLRRRRKGGRSRRRLRGFARLSRRQRRALAKKGWRSRRRKKKAFARSQTPMAWLHQSERLKAANPRRRRRRRSRNYSTWIPSFSENPRRGRRRFKLLNPSTWIPAFSNPSWIPSYAINPAKKLVGSLTAGFSPSVVMKAVPVAGGALANAYVTALVAPRMPSMFQSGVGSLGLGLATSGLLGALVGMVSPRFAGPIFLGGIIEVATRAARKFVPGLSGCCNGPMGDYLTPVNVAEARPLGCYGMGCMGDYALEMETGSYLPDYSEVTGINNVGLPSYAQATNLNPYPYGMQGMGEYLTVQNVQQARALDPVESVMHNELATQD